MNESVKRKRFFSILAIVFSIIYLCWRAFCTLPLDYGIVSIIVGIGLLLAEMIGIISGTEQLIVIDKNQLPKCPDIPVEKYPHVDVLIATHNESEDLLFKTINGCQNMDYPDKSKVHIYVCDDKNRSNIKKLAKQMGVGYLGLEENTLAKAGNLNNALKKTNSPLVATFDADMIPLHTFLMDTVPYFFLPELEKNDEKIGFIQTPQSFYNADLFQYNLYSEDNVPNEQNFFFREINIVRNRTNTPIYAGSNTLIAREALEAVGGIATGLITEDFATGIRIQKKGYRCYAIDSVEANGLAPKDIKSLIRQRERWARGCIQSLRKEHILFSKSFKLGQKLSYLNSLLYWYNPFCRLMYIIAPILFGLFGIYVLNYTFVKMLFMWFPYFITYNFAIKFASGNIRNSRLSNLYDTILFPYLIIPIVLESLGIKKKKFAVTKKDNSNVGKGTFKYAIPHIAVAILSLLALLRCVRIAVNTASPYYLVVICWLVYNLYSIIMSIFFVLGRRIDRNIERIKAKIRVEVECKYGKLIGDTLDLSDYGMSVKFDFPEYIDDDEVVTIKCNTERYQTEFKASVVYFMNTKEAFKYAFEITEINEENKRNYLNIIYDREPTLPEIIGESASVFSEFSSNIHKRFKKYTRNSRRLARICIDKKLTTSDGDKVMLYNFNYEHMLIGYRAALKKPEICFEFEGSVAIKGVIEDTKRFRLLDNKVAALYSITNLEEFINNDNFRKLLNNWVSDYRIRAYEMEKRKKLKEKSNDDELDEMEYVWGGDDIEK